MRRMLDLDPLNLGKSAHILIHGHKLTHTMSTIGSITYPLSSPLNKQGVPPSTSLLSCKPYPRNSCLVASNLYRKLHGNIAVSAVSSHHNLSPFAAHPKSVVVDLPNNKFEEFLQTLPQQRNWDGRMLCKYQDYWFPVLDFCGVLSCQNNFKAHETDIILATMPKAGTTWLKALTFTIIHRNLYNTIDESPLLTSSSHDLVPFLELDTYRVDENPNLENIPSPRIFTTHMPYVVLPDSIPESGCKIVYICRNPLDQFVSHRHFLLKNRLQPDEEPLSLDEAFEMYCNGVHPFGPFWNHMLEYWNAHLEKPDKVLFLKYEDLKEDIVSGLKKMAEFVGMPFSVVEEKKGVIEEIARLCSIENLKSLNVNKEGKWNGIVANSSFYRKGEVGDWKNHLSSPMAERIEKILEEKLSGSGLTFKRCIKYS